MTIIRQPSLQPVLLWCQLTHIKAWGCYWLRFPPHSGKKTKTAWKLPPWFYEEDPQHQREQVRSERIRNNKKLRFWFCNIQKIEPYINKRPATYMRKILGAWMLQLRKVGGQQLSCKNNFAQAISAVNLTSLQPENKGLYHSRIWPPLCLMKQIGFLILSIPTSKNAE